MSNLLLKQRQPKSFYIPKKRSQESAQDIYRKIFQSTSKKHQAKQCLVTLGQLSAPKAKTPPKRDIDHLVSLYNQDSLQNTFELAKELTNDYPGAFIAWNILGATCHRLGNIKEADSAFRKVISLNPSYPDGHSNLGTLLTQQGRLDEAISSYEQAIRINPEHADLFNNLGSALHQQSKLEESIDAYEKAIQIKPDYAEAFNNLGNVFRENNEINKAIDSFYMAVAYRPDYAEASNNLGNAFHEIGKFDSAINAYKSAVTIKKDYAEAYYNMANALQGLGDLGEAIEAYQKAIDIRPDYPEAYHNMGSAFQDEGKLDQAKEAYNNAIIYKPDYVMAFHHLSVIKTFAKGDPQIKRLDKLIADPELTELDRCRLFFVSAKVQEDLEQIDKSFRDLKKGGRLRKKLLNYHIQQDQRLFNDIKQTASIMKGQSIPPLAEPADPIPIFILGMPRSGTSLIEQIISCHSEVLGAGELELFGQLAGEISSGSKLTEQKQILEIRQNYLQELQKLSNGHHYVTDKFPHNFLYVGLIISALPEAKIIHVTRNPAATCWSNFKTYFSSNGLGYSYDLRDTVDYYQLYEDLMNYWHRQYGKLIYRLDYDLLTINQEIETKRLITHLGLDWDTACLSPHENKRIIRTASQQQVRQRIYTGSSNEWRKFEPFLGGIFDELLH